MFVSQDFECPRFNRPGFVWDMSCAGDAVEKFLEVVSEHHYVEMVREICKCFRKEVSPKLHILPKQFIHGDLNHGNIIMAPEGNGNLRLHGVGFIDFGFLNYSCRIFDAAIFLMHIFNVPPDRDLRCGRTRMAGHFLAGYNSVSPLSREEIELLPVLIASKFCQSLVYMAHANKETNPDNENIMDLTTRSGWRNLETFWKLPREGILGTWRQMNSNV